MRRLFWVVGDNFTQTSGGHTGASSTYGKYSKEVIWNPTASCDAVFHLDAHILRKMSVSPHKKHEAPTYGWLLESNSLIQGVTDTITDNLAAAKFHFDNIFTSDQSLIDLDPDFFKFAPAAGFWIKEPQIYEKTKLISMIASNKNMTEGHQKRLQIVHKYRNRVDFYGRGFNYIENKEDGLKDYMFSIAVENGCYANYFTEKIMDCFACGTIPIYKGNPNIGEFFNEDGIITLDDDFSISDLSKELYYSKMEAIKDNLERIKQYEIPEDYIVRNYFKEQR